MKRIYKALVASLLVAGAVQAQAQAYNLTFDSSVACGAVSCGNYTALSQSYGDVASVVDVSFIDVNAPNDSLRYWNSGYNDLSGVAWANGGDANSHARIEIKSLNGNAVTLNSMDFGAYSYATRGTHIRVTTIGGGTQLFSYDGNVGLGYGLHNTFAPAVSANGGLWIDWYNSAYNVGIDNVNFSMTAAVPEPESYAMLLAGLGLIGTLSARRRGRRV